jgi:hypothetical protein
MHRHRACPRGSTAIAILSTNYEILESPDVPREDDAEEVFPNSSVEALTSTFNSQLSTFNLFRKDFDDFPGRKLMSARAADKLGTRHAGMRFQDLEHGGKLWAARKVMIDLYGVTNRQC